MTAATPRPSGVTLTPRVGMTNYSDIAQLPIHDDGSDPNFTFTGNVAAKFDAQLTLGVSADYRPLLSRWGGFADFSRSGGGTKFAGTFCDPDLGCDTSSIDAEGSQWRASAGVSRRVPFGVTSMATFSLGALYAETHFEVKDATQGGRQILERVQLRGGDHPALVRHGSVRG